MALALLLVAAATLPFGQAATFSLASLMPLPAMVAAPAPAPASSPAPASTTPTLPSQDSFYDAPDGYENASPGTILRYRPPPVPIVYLGATATNLKAAYQIQFRTTDTMGNPQAAVTTVMIPQNANYSRLVTYLDFEDSAFLDCSPSYAILANTGSNTTLSKSAALFQSSMLTEGYIINLPDYEGPTSAFGSGLQAGQATLDSTRAVLKSSAFTGIAPSNVAIQLWGYSGGSIPAQWAAELQPTYAPELNFLSAVVGGVIANLTSLILTIEGTNYAGFGPAGFMGLVFAYNTPSLQDFMNSNLIAATAAQFKSSATMCATPLLSAFSGTHFGQWFKSGLSTLYSPTVQAIIEATGIMGQHGLPKMPLYYYKAISDQISPVADTDKLVAQYCAQGIGSLQYYRNTLGEHLSESVLGGGSAIGFLKDTFNGVRPPKGCKIQTVTLSTVDAGALSGFGSFLAGNIVNGLGAPLGPLAGPL